MENKLWRKQRIKLLYGFFKVKINRFDAPFKVINSSFFSERPEFISISIPDDPIICAMENSNRVGYLRQIFIIGKICYGAGKIKRNKAAHVVPI